MEEKVENGDGVDKSGQCVFCRKMEVSGRKKRKCERTGWRMHLQTLEEHEPYVDSTIREWTSQRRETENEFSRGKVLKGLLASLRRSNIPALSQGPHDEQASSP
jgi:transcriptional regulator NrdR family protein